MTFKIYILSFFIFSGSSFCYHLVNKNGGNNHYSLYRMAKDEILKREDNQSVVVLDSSSRKVGFWPHDFNRGISEMNLDCLILKTKKVLNKKEDSRPLKDRIKKITDDFIITSFNNCVRKIDYSKSNEKKIHQSNSDYVCER